MSNTVYENVSEDKLLEIGDYVRKSVDDWLNDVNYSDLNDGKYVPSIFALMYVNFVKMVNGSEGESHATPPLHLKMLDKMVSDKDYVVNLVFRGAAKTTLFFEYLVLFIAYYGGLPMQKKDKDGNYIYDEQGYPEIYIWDVPGMIYVSDSMENGVKSARKNIEFRYDNSEFCQENLPNAKFTDSSIYMVNKDGKRLGVKMFGAKTGLRGTKIDGKRPVLCVLDDLISDDSAKSKTDMEAIKDTVYKGVDYALDPTRRKVFFNGTPFNSEDIMIEAVESGAWDVNVWPVCEQWPVEEEDFVGAWPDRFSYEYILKAYERAVLNRKVGGFMQELMLRITSDEERLIQDDDIRWYSRAKLLANKGNYNFYITSDLALSEKEKADFSVIAVWAYNANGDWFWVDGICARQKINKTYDDLFRLVQLYKPLSVGIEVNGQQMGFIPWLMDQMIERNIWFSFASANNGTKPGIRAVQNKLVRLQGMVPQFAAGKLYFPSEMKTTKIMGHYMGQIRLATESGLKGKDDCLDTISMLQYLKPWKPSDGNAFPDQDATPYRLTATRDADDSPLDNYIV